MPTTILGLGGSLRPGSTTTLALHIALDGAAASGAAIHHLNLADVPLPMFNGTYSLDGYSPSERQTIEQLFDAIANAQGIILASPTYHNAISGAMKNALDLLEIGTEDLPPRMAGKVAGLVTVQGGTSGTGNNTLTTMLLAARAMHAWVAPTMVSVPGSRSAFNTDGQIIDTAIDARLRALGAQVASASAVFAALTVK